MKTITAINLLESFINQRPGFDLMNYDSMSSYREDYRPVLQAKHDAQTMIRYIELSSITGDNILKASKGAFSGRLSFVNEGDSWWIDYCTGQYFPTEYRSAACSVLSATIWNYWRECGYNSGDELRDQAKSIFGRAFANRWFN